MKDGVLAAGAAEDLMVFTADAVFSSSSAAAAIVSGAPQSGPAGWKLADGHTLREVEAAELGE